MKYIFTEEQFITLLALAGEKKVYLFEQAESISDVAIVSAVTDLYHMGRVIRQHEIMEPSAELMEFIRTMSRSKRIIELRFAEDSFLQHLIYVVKAVGVVILERKSLLGASVVKMWSMNADDYVRDLIESGMLPEDLIEKREEAAVLEATVLKDQWAGDSKDFLLRVRRIDPKNEEVGNTIEVLSSPVFKRLCVYGTEGSYEHIYSVEELSVLLLNEINGVEI